MRNETDGECNHTFAEEKELSGRVILCPCLVCGMTALDAMEELKRERDYNQTIIDKYSDIGRSMVERRK